MRATIVQGVAAEEASVAAYRMPAILRTVRRGRVPGNDCAGMRRHDDVEVVTRCHGAAVGQGEVHMAGRKRWRLARA